MLNVHIPVNTFNIFSLLRTQGIPKNRRGEIWRYLLKQDLLRRKPSTMPSVSLSYKELKEMRSIHQHAILIDCSKHKIYFLVNLFQYEYIIKIIYQL